MTIAGTDPYQTMQKDIAGCLFCIGSNQVKEFDAVQLDVCRLCLIVQTFIQCRITVTLMQLNIVPAYAMPHQRRHDQPEPSSINASFARFRTNGHASSLAARTRQASASFDPSSPNASAALFRTIPLLSCRRRSSSALRATWAFGPRSASRSAA